MEQYTRKARMVELRKYDHLAKEHDFMELTEWHNGEGWDITVGEKTFTLTYGEYEALQALIHYKG